MHDARDAADARLIAEGEFARLLETYRGTIAQLARLHVRGDGWEDVVQSTLLHLWRELRAGKTYSVPFRVVVYSRTVWIAREYLAGRRFHDQLEDGELSGADGIEIDDWSYLRRLFAELPPGDRRVAELRFVLGLEIG